MKQSRGTSLLKSIVSTAVGFAVALVANALVLPFFGYTPTLAENVLLTTVYTVISIARGYALERLFEALGWRTRMSAFALAVLAERQRQISVEGWTVEHDDNHPAHELARAGITYIECAPCPPAKPPTIWPWTDQWWKPSGYRRDLVKGCALVIAEGERFDRQRKRPASAAAPVPPARAPWNSATRVGWPADHEPAPLAHGKTRSTHGGSSA